MVSAEAVVISMRDW